MKVRSSASAKTILFGEHAVVYGEPALAIPLPKTRTYAEMHPNRKEFRVISEGVHLNKPYSGLIPGSGLQVLLSRLQEYFQLEKLPEDTLTIRSDIPIASGLGSGAALSIAVIRAFAARFRKELDTETVNSLAYGIEVIYHGTPSGIDNTTIAYEKPICFSKTEGIRPLDFTLDGLDLLVVDSGIRSRTIEVVSDVRENFDRNEPYIREIGSLVRNAENTLREGNAEEIGKLMDQNQELLRKIDVSCPELDRYIDLAKAHGAAGAKLTGAGRGGNFLVLARDPDQAETLKNLYEINHLKVIS